MQSARLSSHRHVCYDCALRIVPTAPAFFRRAPVVNSPIRTYFTLKTLSGYYRPYLERYNALSSHNLLSERQRNTPIFQLQRRGYRIRKHMTAGRRGDPPEHKVSKHDHMEEGRRSASRQSRKRRDDREEVNHDESLIPSEPSPSLGSSNPPPFAETETTDIWAPEAPSNNFKLRDNIMHTDLNLYWDLEPPTIAQKQHAKHFFTRPSARASFLRSVPEFRQFPGSDIPEIAFLGRSNVGKSSLLNALINANTKSMKEKAVAHTSSRPGFTRTMNLFGVSCLGNGVAIKQAQGPRDYDKIVALASGTSDGSLCPALTLVDMPGYGEGSLQEWGVEIMKYVRKRKQLRRVFVLVDAKTGITSKDQSILASLRLTGVPHQVILSKVDKVYLPEEAREIKRYDGKTFAKLKPKGSKADIRQKMEAMVSEIQPPVGGGGLGEILACSSEVLVDNKRIGIDAIRFAMLRSVGLEANAKGHGGGGSIQKRDGSDKERGKWVRKVSSDAGGGWIWKRLDTDMGDGKEGKGTTTLD